MRIKSRVVDYEDRGGCVKVFSRVTRSFWDVVERTASGLSCKMLHGLNGPRAARHVDDGRPWTRPKRRVARDTVGGQKALRRYSGFTCYAALANHKLPILKRYPTSLLGDKERRIH